MENMNKYLLIVKEIPEKLRTIRKENMKFYHIDLKLKIMSIIKYLKSYLNYLFQFLQKKLSQKVILLKKLNIMIS